MLFVLVEETPKENRNRKKQKSPELEEGTHLVTESFLFCKTKVLRLYNGGISSGSVVLEIDRFILLLVLVEETLKEKGRKKQQRSLDLDEGRHLITRSQNLFVW